MKTDKINRCIFKGYGEFTSKPHILQILRPRVFKIDEIDTFIKMEDKFIDAEIDLVRAFSKKNSKLHAALKGKEIKKYDVPLLRTLLINPVFDDERIMGEIPHMLSIKWPRELDNRLCAEGRKNIADLYATTPILNENPALQAKIGEILSNCTTKESSEYTMALLNRYLSNKLIYENKYLTEHLPEMIIKLQDSLYDSRIDKNKICQSMADYMSSFSQKA